MTRHRTDPLSFAAGAVCVVVAVLVTGSPGQLAGGGYRLVGPALLVIVGFAALMAVTRGRDEVTAARRDDRGDVTE